MKKILKIILFGLAALLTVAVLFLLLQSIRLKWWSAPENVTLIDLTGEQKAADMGYLLDLTRQVSQADAVWKAAGMENPLDQPETWIEGARRTASNREFADLVMQYLVHLGQGGHAFMAYDVNFNIVTSLVSNTPRDAYAKMPQWAAMIGSLPWNTHSNLDIPYLEGKYVLGRETRFRGNTLPAGAVVERVDGLSVDDFVMAQQYRTHLRYDPVTKKFFIYPLLTIDPGSDRSGWEVTFRLPDGSEQTVSVQKYPGYEAYRPDESHTSNVRCLTVQEGVLYIKILTFSGATFDQDAAALHQCFGSGSFQKVIFDIRSNNGGEVWSYMDNIMAPLTRKPLTYTAISAVKDGFNAYYGWRLWLFRATNNNDLIDPVAHVTGVEEISFPPFSEEGWRVIRVTHRIEPAANPFPFEGQAYVLADNNALSAGDSFAAAMQKTGLAKLVGANTVGWGQAYQAKMLYGLPNSGILFYMDSELTFNPDGSLNNFVGIIPDVTLNPSSFPTPYPMIFTPQAIRADEWVRWVLADTEQ